MKKSLSFLAIATIVVMATLMLQGCHNNEANEERSAIAAERTAEATERVADAVESLVPRSITDRESGSTVGWAALSLAERQEVLDWVGVATTHQPGDQIKPNPPIQKVTFVLYLTDVPSPQESQTLLEYEYSDSGLTGKNRIMVQGHIETSTGKVPIESIPYLLNGDNCCYRYGGCINGTTCSEQRPRTEPCKPKPQVEPCRPCQQQGQGTPGPSRRQGDGAAPSQKSNGRSHVLPPVDL